jgi:probable F420-dependent oxidoreductase
MYGLNVINAWPPAFIVELATVADESGWDGFFLWDHLTFEFDVPLHDPWVVLGALAARTERLRLGPLVTPLARRRPHQIAKEAVTLDHLSNGRAVLGVGLGGVDREFAAFGEAHAPRVRAEKLDEACSLIARFWTGTVVLHQGRYFAVDDVALQPAPLQRPRIPIWVGGHSRAAMRRASRWDGWAPGGPAPSVGDPGVALPALRRAIASLRRHRADPFDVVYSVEMPESRRALTALVDRVRALGVTWLLEYVHGLRFTEDTARERVARGPPER